jgi:D-serine deaminase-like pyridoxal phosphate-dependent protein
VKKIKKMTTKETPPSGVRGLWYQLNSPNQADSPSLLIYKDRVASNIQKMIAIAGNVERLITHVKTNKMPEIVKMMIEAGISKFKCATIAEAEMSAIAGAKYIIIAHQLVGPKIKRLIEFHKKYPDVLIASLIDDLDNAALTNQIFKENNLKADVFIDINSGMDRSGHRLDDNLWNLYQFIQDVPNLTLHGLHVYDGHIRDAQFEDRKATIDSGFVDVEHFIEKILENDYPRPMIVAGGTPAFTVHALRDKTYCSPGTCVLWDWGYGDRFAEQPFEYAALVLTRVISKPQKGIITVDMGHKALSAENPIDKRIRFLNLENYELTSQSEEHGVIAVQDWDSIKVGDVLYGVPYHVCPTVNAYDEAYVIEDGQVIDTWQVLGRKRRINV